MGSFQRKKNKRSTKEEWKYVGRAFLVLCIVALSLAYRLWQDGIFYFDHETETIPGTVTHVNWSPERHNDYYYAIHYEYSINDTSYNGIDKIIASPSQFQKGDEIEVQVLQRIPEISNIKIDE